ncbi:MAG: hypothetical protein IBX55_00400 [Methyloprofundus sp.]|nr:hypothetical protein [Methyloprofundus sp.]
MLIDIENPDQILSHFLLEDKQACEAVLETEEWQSSRKIIPTVFFNGVEVEAEFLEDALKNLLDQVKDSYAKKYDVKNIDNMVEERAESLLREHAGDALNVIRDLQSKLENTDDMLTPYWERG